MTPFSGPFSDDVCLFILEDVGIVFSEPAQEIYELNAAATWIWCQLEDGRPSESLPKALADTFGFTEAAARDHLAQTIEAWRDLGFFAGERPQIPRKNATVKRPKRAAQGKLARNLVSRLRLGLSGADARRIKTYRSLGQNTAVVYPTEAIESLVHPALSHVAQKRPALTPQSIIEIEPRGAGFAIKRDGQTKYRDIALEQLTPVTQFLVYLAGIEIADYVVAFHAGAVALDGRVAVLPGRAGNGKTSLTAALLHEGFRYLSDDLLLMSDDLTIEGVPFALGVKDSGVAPLLRYYPDLPTLPLHHRLDGKRVRYLSAPLISTLSQNEPLKLPAAWVIFPKYRPDGPTALKPLGKSEALRRLMESSTLALPLTRLQIETFIRWLEGLSCYDLQVNDLASAVSTVKDVMTRKTTKEKSLNA